MADIRESKYAHFLEDVCSDIVTTEPKNIAVVFFSDDGEAHTHYFGTCYPAEVGQMSWQLNADACLTLTQANAGLFLEAAEQEDEDGEPEED